ncbi:hypothetical protein [Agromyces sp. NPDC058126]|uniref:hypothetical protein n=1 Tax=Agromyces sp. NPDC058126 TaxID=3346350 RepID=UPI0036DBF2C0
MNKKKMAAVTGALTAVLGVSLALGAVPAYADGIGVALSHGTGGTTGLAVHGSGSQVDWVKVSHGDGYPRNYCGFQAKFGGTLAGGSAYSTTYGWEAACVPLFTERSKSIVAKFKLGTNVWGQAYHDGEWTGGKPTVAIQ